MGKIVAIGGGELSRGDTRKLDEYIVSLCERSKPQLLFLPTASMDALTYIERIHQYFEELGCQVNELCLASRKYMGSEIRDQILSADIIYVGGGDTVRMMECWKRLRVDQYLHEAYRRDIILSGISAGSLCWFLSGHSDSNSFTNPDHWEFIRAYGLGLIPAVHCPHYNEPERKSFDEMMEIENLPGIALEDGTAFVEEDGIYRILRAENGGHAFLLRNWNGHVKKEELMPGVPIQL